MMVVSGHREDGQLCVGRIMSFAPQEVNAHRHLSRSKPFFVLRDGRTMAHRSHIAGERVSPMIDDDR